MGKGWFGKTVALVLVVSVGVVFSAGCFGKFQLTRSLYQANQSIEDKYLRSFVTWLLVIIPVYGVAGLLDFILFNVIEFWSGENPVVAEQKTRVFEQGDDRFVMTIGRVDGTTVATVEKYRADALVSTLRIRDDGSGSVTSELIEGKKVTRTTTATQEADGSVSVSAVTPDGTESRRHSPVAVETYRARLARLAGEAKGALSGGGSAAFADAVRVPALQG